MEQGLLYCFMVLGVYITFRVLDFPDLTVDGSLPLGAAVTAAMATGGHSVYLATAAGMGAGLVAGLFTGLLHLCLLYTSDAADDLLCVDLGGRRIIKKKK